MRVCPPSNLLLFCLGHFIHLLLLLLLLRHEHLELLSLLHLGHNFNALLDREALRTCEIKSRPYG